MKYWLKSNRDTSTHNFIEDKARYIQRNSNEQFESKKKENN